MKRSFPNPIPPGSIVRQIRAGVFARRCLGRVHKIGYYSKQDGLDCIWLVDENGTYKETCTHAYLQEFFHIEVISPDTNLYGINRDPLDPCKGLQKPNEHFPPPGTLLRLRKANRRLKRSREEVGCHFQVGYYSPEAGLETIRIGDEHGHEVGTIPRKGLYTYFDLVELSSEENFSGIPGLPQVTPPKTT